MRQRISTHGPRRGDGPRCCAIGCRCCGPTCAAVGARHRLRRAYLRLWREQAAGASPSSPPQMGAARWPAGAPNLSCTAEEDALPFPDLVFDRVLMIHGLEAAENARRMLRETWRVLKDDGRLLIVAPNRTGLWAYLEIDPVRPRPTLFLRPARPAAHRVAVPGGAAGSGTPLAAQPAPPDPAHRPAAGAGRRACSPPASPA